VKPLVPLAAATASWMPSFQAWPIAPAGPVSSTLAPSGMLVALPPEDWVEPLLLLLLLVPLPLLVPLLPQAAAVRPTAVVAAISAAVRSFLGESRIAPP